MANQVHGWPPASIRQRQRDHRELEQAVRQLTQVTPDIVERSLVRYLVIRSAGLVESVRDDAASMYSQRIGHPRLHRRISTGLSVGLGVHPKQLLDFVASFDADWREDLQRLLDEDDARRSNHLGALVAARKKIAHGDGDQVTARKALQWSQTAAELASWVITRFDPT
jgi:hypothetical protein